MFAEIVKTIRDIARPANMCDAPLDHYFTACRRVKVKCPNCEGGIADRGAYRMVGVRGFVPITKCRNCGHLFDAGRPQAEGAK